MNNKPDFFLKNKLANKDYYHISSFKNVPSTEPIPAVKLIHVSKTLKKPTDKFNNFMRQTFMKDVISPNKSLKPINFNSFTQRTQNLEERGASLFNQKINNDTENFSNEKNSKKKLTFSTNNISSSEDEFQLSKIKRELTFCTHLRELKNLKEEENLEKKLMTNEIQKGKNIKLKKRMSIMKFIAALKTSSQNSLSSFRLNPTGIMNQLTNMQNKKYFTLMGDVENVIEKLDKSLGILMKTAGGNRKLIANVLMKQVGYNEDIGKLFLDSKMLRVRNNISKENLLKNIKKHLEGMRANSLGFLEKLTYFNNNLLSYVIDKDKEWFEIKTNEIKNDLEKWRQTKEEYLEKIASQSKTMFFSKKKMLEQASNYHKPQGTLMNKIIWENLEKNERNLGDYSLLGSFNRAQWVNIQNLEAALE